MELNKDFKEFIELLNGYEPYRIDLMVDIEGLEFEACYKNKVQSKLDGAIVNFLGLNDLVLAKQIAGRLQDLADAEKLVQIKRKNEERNQ